MTDEQIKYMVDRFLGWRLPEHFRPDAGISFKPEYNEAFNAARGKPPALYQPIGTNLFDATQAEAMVRYMVEEMPQARWGNRPMNTSMAQRLRHNAEILVSPRGAAVPYKDTASALCTAAELLEFYEEALRAIRDLRRSSFRTDRQDVEDMRRMAGIALQGMRKAEAETTANDGG